jgi:hypothetical protein
MRLWNKVCLFALAKNAKSLDAPIWYDCHSYVGIRFIHIDEVCDEDMFFMRSALLRTEDLGPFG